MGGYSSLFMAAPISSAPVYDPVYFPVNPPIFDPSGGLFGGLNSILNNFLPGGGGPVSVPISGFSPVQGPTNVVTMPTPVSSKCLLGHGHRRMNWANFRALNRANRRLHAFNKHARRYIKITHKVKSPKRRKRS